MNKAQHGTLTALAAACLMLTGANMALSSGNRALQGDINQRQQYVQQSAQLEGLYREIVRGLAELGARHNDRDVRAMLQRHGITYTVNPPAASANAPAAPARK